MEYQTPLKKVICAMKFSKHNKFFLLIGGIGLSFFFGVTFATKKTIAPQLSSEHSEKNTGDVPETLQQPMPDNVLDSDTWIETEEDGTHILWIRSNTGTIITRYHFTPDGNLSDQMIYHTDARGRIMWSKFYDGNKIEMFKIRYGYSVADQLLVEEQIFDSRTKHFDSNNKELPVLRVVHIKDQSTGKKSPIPIQLVVMDMPAVLKSGLRNPFLKEENR